MQKGNYILEETKETVGYIVDNNLPKAPQTFEENDEVVGVSEFIERNNLTKKAKLLYKNGFCSEPKQVSKVDSSYRDVTFNNGFNGFTVYLGVDMNLYLAKPETENGNIYSYYLTKLENITDEQYQNLLTIKEEGKKLNLVSIFKWVSLAISIIGFALTILSIVTDMQNGADFIIAIISSSLTLLFSGMLAGITGLLFKK